MKDVTVAIYFDEEPAQNSTSTFATDFYKLAYSDLIKRILLAGAHVIIAYDAKRNYIRNFCFKNYWDVKINNDGIKYKKITPPRLAKFDILYDKGRFPFDISRKVNSNQMRKICDNKYLTYLFASEFHARSFILHKPRDLKIFAMSHQDTRVALKALDGYGGEQVFVGYLRDYANNIKFPLLAQEFIDTSDGTPDRLARGIHDVRVGLFNGEPICGLLREPRMKDELRTNFALGGKTRHLFVREIPPILVEKTRELDRRFNFSGPRFFAADWGFDKSLREWKLFEINKSPGLGHSSQDGPAADEFLQLLAEKLIENARDNHAH